MGTEAIEKIIKLMAKAGLFFARADGQYDVREKSFIANFIDKLSAVGPADEVEALLAGALDKQYSLDEVIADTKDLLDDFNPTERGAILLMIDGFIEQVISADGKKTSDEIENFTAWQKAVA